MTNSPCYDVKTKTDCPRRCLGCREKCAEWAEWEIIHKAEMMEIRKKKNSEMAADAFIGERKKRIKNDSGRRYEKKMNRR